MVDCFARTGIASPPPPPFPLRSHSLTTPSESPVNNVSGPQNRILRTRPTAALNCNMGFPVLADKKITRPSRMPKAMYPPSASRHSGAASRSWVYTMSFVEASTAIMRLSIPLVTMRVRLVLLPLRRRILMPLTERL